MKKWILTILAALFLMLLVMAPVWSGDGSPPGMKYAYCDNGTQPYGGSYSGSSSGDIEFLPAGPGADNNGTHEAVDPRWVSDAGLAQTTDEDRDVVTASISALHVRPYQKLTINYTLDPPAHDCLFELKCVPKNHEHFTGGCLSSMYHLLNEDTMIEGKIRGSFTIEVPNKLWEVWEFRFEGPYSTSIWNKCMYRRVPFQIVPYETDFTCPNLVEPGKNLLISFENASPHPDAWIGFFKYDNPNQPLHTHQLRSLLGGQWQVRAPEEPGFYRVVTYQDGSWDYPAGECTVRVGYEETCGFTDVPPAGQKLVPIWVNYFGAPNQINAWAGLYKQGETNPGNTYSFKDLMGNTSGQVGLTAHEPGVWEFRMYDHYKNLLAVSSPVRVSLSQAAQSVGAPTVGGSSNTSAAPASPGGLSISGGGAGGGGGGSSTGSAAGISLQVGSGSMTVGGVNKEIDPGQGTAPVIVNGRTFVPIRAIVEAMGGTMGWNGTERKVTIVYQGTIVELWIGGKTARVNGRDKPLDEAPFVSPTGRTMLPLRFVTENLGSQVQWDGANQRITITSGGISQTPPTSTQPPAGTPPERGLIAHYKFDGDFRDSSGSGNDGRLNGDVGFVDGVLGKCAQFKGGFLQVADKADLDLTGPYTISAWIKIEPGSDSTIISKLADNGSDSTYFANAYDYDSELGASDSTLQMWMSYDYDNCHYTEASVEVEGQDVVNKWAHAAFTNDGATISLYVDGVLQGTAQAPKDNYVITSDNDMLIGKIIQSGASSYFKGRMDDLRIYNYALSSTEIKALLQGASVGASSFTGVPSTAGSSNGQAGASSATAVANFAGAWKLNVNGEDMGDDYCLVLQQNGSSVSGYCGYDRESGYAFTGTVSGSTLNGKFYTTNPATEWEFKVTMSVGGRSFDGTEYYSNPPWSVHGERK